MKTQEIKNKSTEEIIILINDLKQELFQLRFQLAINQLENPMRIRTVRKEIARAKTVIKQRELEQAEQENSDK